MLSIVNGLLTLPLPQVIPEGTPWPWAIALVVAFALGGAAAQAIRILRKDYTALNDKFIDALQDRINDSDARNEKLLGSFERLAEATEKQTGVTTALLSDRDQNLSVVREAIAGQKQIKELLTRVHTDLIRLHGTPPGGTGAA